MSDPAGSKGRFGAIADDPIFDAHCRAVTLAFAVEGAAAREWLTRTGRERLRALTDARGAYLAGLSAIPMGQFFGGRRVPMLGIAGVAVPPEGRGKGAALELMRAVVREAAATGFPISTLYPATQWLYRRCGYEQAGAFFEAKVNPKLIEVRDLDRATTVRDIRPDDDGAMREVYTRLAALADGHLDRPEYIWHRIREPRDGAAHGFVVEHEGKVEGYVWLSQKRNDTGKHDATITDIAASTPRAARRLLAFLRDLRSMCDAINWKVAPGSPFLMLMPEHPYQVRLREVWMVRIADVKGAIEARGYPAGMVARFALEIADDAVEANAGRWEVRVEGGSASVERRDAASAPTLRLDVRALAPLYTGYLSAEALVATGAASGDAGAMEAASMVFAPRHRAAGVAPSMVDFF